MANYCGSTRSNYVKVKSEEDWKKLCELYDFELYEGDDDKWGFGFGFDDDSDGAGLPYINFKELSVEAKKFIDSLNKNDYNYSYNDVLYQFQVMLGLFASLLEDGEILIIQHVGQEKMRFLKGLGYAIDNNFNMCAIDLNDIIVKAAKEMKGLTLDEDISKFCSENLVEY